MKSIERFHRQVWTASMTSHAIRASQRMVVGSEAEFIASCIRSSKSAAPMISAALVIISRLVIILL
jgi:hypothetical protein